LSLWNELKRRNVIRVAAAYAIVGWIVIEIASVAAPALRLPEWTTSFVIFLILVGLPLAIIFAWAFELTPDGLKREANVERSDSITPVTGRKLDFSIIGFLLIALAYFIYGWSSTDDRFDVDPGNVAVNGSIYSIAVLPFVNMSDDAANEYFSDGLSEELLNLLAKIPELRVAARTSSFSFKDQPEVTTSEIARILNVEHILEGSVRKSGNQIRITAQLINAKDGFHIWSETYDRQLENIFVTQDEIAAAVTESLQVTLLGNVPTSVKTDATAYEVYLEGQYLANKASAASLLQAAVLYRKALDIDPNYAPAWTGLAGAIFWHAAYTSVRIGDIAEETLQAIERAIELDPEFGLSYYYRGLIQQAYDLDVNKAGMSFRKAMQLDPGNADILFGHALFLHDSGKFADAASLLRRALERDPIRARFHEFLGRTYMGMGQLDMARAAFKRQIAASPNYPGAYYRMARALVLQGDAAQALLLLDKETEPVYSLTGLAMAHYALGNIEDADQALATLIETQSLGAAFQIAEVYASRRDTENTFLWLENAYENRDSGLITLLATPEFHYLQKDPRWPVYLERIGLREAWSAMPLEWRGPS
jgi:adenylate cyclase